MLRRRPLALLAVLLVGDLGIALGLTSCAGPKATVPADPGPVAEPAPAEPATAAVAAAPVPSEPKVPTAPVDPPSPTHSQDLAPPFEGVELTGAPADVAVALGRSWCGQVEGCEEAQTEVLRYENTTTLAVARLRIVVGRREAGLLLLHGVRNAALIELSHEELGQDIDFTHSEIHDVELRDVTGGGEDEWIASQRSIAEGSPSFDPCWNERTVDELLIVCTERESSFECFSHVYALYVEQVAWPDADAARCGQPADGLGRELAIEVRPEQLVLTMAANFAPASYLSIRPAPGTLALDALFETSPYYVGRFSLLLEFD